MKSPDLTNIESLPSSDDSLAGATANVFGGFTEEQVRSGVVAPWKEDYSDSPVMLGGITNEGACGRPQGWER